MRHENEELHNSLKSSQLSSLELEAVLQEKNQEVCRLNDDVISLQNKIQHLEEMYRKEIETQMERVNLKHSSFFSIPISFRLFNS